MRQPQRRNRASGLRSRNTGPARGWFSHFARLTLLNGRAVVEVHRVLVRFSPSASRRAWE